MNYVELRAVLHNQLDELIEACQKQDPADGIVDLKLSILSVDPETEVSTTLDSNVELVEMADESWEVEAFSVWTTTHETHRDDL